MINWFKLFYLIMTGSILTYLNASNIIKTSSIAISSTKKEACKKALFQLTNDVALQAGVEVSSTIEISKSSTNGNYKRNVRQKQSNKVSKIVKILSKKEKISYNSVSGMIECRIQATVKVLDKIGKFSHIIADSKNEVLYDEKAKLEWLDSFATADKENYKKDWNFAYKFCENLSHHKQQDWRLPSKSEIGNIGKFYNKFIFTKKNAYYWSNDVESEEKAYAVGFNKKNHKISIKIKKDNKNKKRYIRCVRNSI